MDESITSQSRGDIEVSLYGDRGRRWTWKTYRPGFHVFGRGRRRLRILLALLHRQIQSGVPFSGRRHRNRTVGALPRRSRETQANNLGLDPKRSYREPANPVAFFLLLLFVLPFGAQSRTFNPLFRFSQSRESDEFYSVLQDSMWEIRRDCWTTRIFTYRSTCWSSLSIPRADFKNSAWHRWVELFSRKANNISGTLKSQ